MLAMLVSTKSDNPASVAIFAVFKRSFTIITFCLQFLQSQPISSPSQLEIFQIKEKKIVCS